MHRVVIVWFEVVLRRVVIVWSEGLMRCVVIMRRKVRKAIPHLVMRNPSHADD